MNILIAIPSMDSVPAVFCQSLATLRKVGDCVVAFQIGSLIYDARNKLGKAAIDMKVEERKRKVKKTMQEKDLDILTGVYYRRRSPYTPVLFDQLEIVDDTCNSTEFDTIPDELFEVGGCGFGCVLMSTDVLFNVMAKYQDLFSPFARVGEDIAFCWRARECGFKIFADPSIALGHYTQQIVTKQFFEAFKEKKDGSIG